mmetsp:Transcript_2456/g.6790  ORF Transcript_2456/g.6790 Transcript_2456/m.6790 type:complete len:247 (+) Transcript_2456:989-1729(+)
MRTSMFPVSGALQLKTSIEKGYFPMISAISMYFRLLRPGPSSWNQFSSVSTSPPASSFFLASCTRSLLRKQFHSPVPLAATLSFSTTGCGVHLSLELSCSTSTSSIAWTFLQNILARCFSSSNLKPSSSPTSPSSISAIAVSMTPLTTFLLPTTLAFFAEALPALALEPTPAKIAATLKRARQTNHLHWWLSTSPSTLAPPASRCALYVERNSSRLGTPWGLSKTRSPLSLQNFVSVWIANTVGGR